MHLRQSTASQSVVIGPFVDSTDGNTAETGLTVDAADIRLSKNGANIVGKNSGGGTHDELGYYTITLDATDTNTVGRLQLMVHESGALPVYHEYEVLEEAVYDALYAASAPGYGTAQTGDAFARLGAPAGASVSADIAAVKVDTAAILVDTGTTLDARIPAALVSGRMDCSVGAMAANVLTATAINADAITAAKIANGAIDAATFAADVDAEILSYIVDDATRIDASALNTLSSHDPGEAIMGATDLGTGAGLTSLASAANLATVDTVVDAIKVTTDKLDTAVELDGAVYRFTTNALEQAPTGGGAADGSGFTAIPWNAAWDAEVQSEVADALSVYDPPTRAELTSDTNSILTAVDALPTNAELATALGTADDAVLAAVATVDTVVDAIKVKTDQLTFGVTNTLNVRITYVLDSALAAGGTGGQLYGEAP